MMVAERFSLCERVDTFSSGKPNIDSRGDQHVLANVVLVSEYSRNVGPNQRPRRYPRETLAASLPLFDSLQVNVNHPPIQRDVNSPTGTSVVSTQRDVLRTIGVARNPRLREIRQDGRPCAQITADLYLIKCDAADHIVKLAELAPTIAGMSLTGDGEFRENEADNFDEVIDLRPATVDVVHRPATTNGFFEAEMPLPLPAKPEAGPGAPDAGKGITQAADQVTLKANSEKTGDAHELAQFAHMKAAGLHAEGGDLNRARQHADKALEHKALAEKLRAVERESASHSPMPALATLAARTGDSAPKIENTLKALALYEGK